MSTNAPENFEVVEDGKPGTLVVYTCPSCSQRVADRFHEVSPWLNPDGSLDLLDMLSDYPPQCPCCGEEA